MLLSYQKFLCFIIRIHDFVIFISTANELKEVANDIIFGNNFKGKSLSIWYVSQDGWGHFHVSSVFSEVGNFKLISTGNLNILANFQQLSTRLGVTKRFQNLRNQLKWLEYLGCQQWSFSWYLIK